MPLQELCQLLALQAQNRPVELKAQHPPCRELAAHAVALLPRQKELHCHALAGLEAMLLSVHPWPSCPLPCHPCATHSRTREMQVQAVEANVDYRWSRRQTALLYQGQRKREKEERTRGLLQPCPIPCLQRTLPLHRT